MRTSLPAIVAMCGVSVLAAGCSSDATTTVHNIRLVGPHGGTVVRLPENAGCVEYLLETEGGEPITTQQDVTKPAGERSRIAAYFLGPDAKAPMESPPSAVSVRLSTDERKMKAVELAPRPRSGDPSGSGRFVSPPDSYVPAMLRGITSATISGRDVRVPIALR